MFGLMMTGHADLKYSIAAMRAGALDLLEKPFDNSRLIEAIGRGLAASQVTREARFQRWMAANSTGFAGITAESAPMRRAMEVTQRRRPPRVPRCSCWASPAPARMYSQKLFMQRAFERTALA